MFSGPWWDTAIYSRWELLCGCGLVVAARLAAPLLVRVAENAFRRWRYGGDKA